MVAKLAAKLKSRIGVYTSIRVHVTIAVILDRDHNEGELFYCGEKVRIRNDVYVLGLISSTLTFFR